MRALRPGRHRAFYATLRAGVEDFASVWNKHVQGKCWHTQLERRLSPPLLLPSISSVSTVEYTTAAASVASFNEMRFALGATVVSSSCLTPPHRGAQPLAQREIRVRPVKQGLPIDPGGHLGQRTGLPATAGEPQRQLQSSQEKNTLYDLNWP